MVVHMDVWMSVCIGHKKTSEYTYQHDLIITPNLFTPFCFLNLPIY